MLTSGRRKERRVGERQTGVIRVAESTVPALREEFARSIDLLNEVLSRLRRTGYLKNPWLGDEVSQTVAVHYTERAMDQPESSYRALLAYRDELARIHETLQRMEDTYHRTEAAADTQFRRQA